MNYKDININILNKNSINTANEIIPLISDFHKNTKLINKLSKINILNKNEFFFYHAKDCKNIPEKIFSLLLTILGKNIRSPFCSLRTILTNDLLSNSSSEIILFLNFFHLYKIYQTNTYNMQKSATTYCLFNHSNRYLWRIERIKTFLSGKKNTNIKICILYNIIELNFIKLLHQIFPNATLVIRFHDMLSNQKQIHFIQKIKKLSFCKCETYSFLDYKKYNINYWPNSVNFIELQKINKKESNQDIYDLYFLGIADNKRLDFLKTLISKLGKQKIKFYIDAVVFDKKNKDNIKNLLMEIINRYNSPSLIEVSPVSYPIYIQHISNSKAIIDLYRLYPDEGLSFRTAEALALKKKIITNRDLNANNLYKFKENILSFDDIDKVNLKEFIDKPYVDPDPELLKQFDINEQIKNYLKN